MPNWPADASQLRLRHSEILTLLCANPEGLTSEELSVGVYGHPAGASSIRVEVSRLRKLLGDCIESEHYRLKCTVSSDVARVCGLLHRGRGARGGDALHRAAAAALRRAWRGPRA